MANIENMIFIKISEENRKFSNFLQTINDIIANFFKL